jgi:hypothetical protein
MEKVYSKTIALIIGLIVLPVFIFAQTGNVNGLVTYQGAYPMSNVTVSLTDDAGNIVGTTVTNSNGEYTFEDIAYGTYTANFTPAVASGGVNLSDAYAVLLHLFNMNPFTSIQNLAADVDGSGNITWNDYNLILGGYLNQGNPFPIGDWVFENTTIEVTGSRDGTIGNQGSSSGDINGTYVPTKAYEATFIENLNTDPLLTSAENVNLELKADAELITAGFHLVFNIPQGLNVSRVSSDLEGVNYSIDKQQLRITWINKERTAVNFSGGSDLLTIEVNTSEAIDGEYLALSLDNQSHLIDNRGDIIPYTSINLPGIKYTAAQDLKFEASLYPNPFISGLNMEYTLPSDGNVIVKFYNSNGQLVEEVMNNYQEKGSHNVRIDASGLSSGIYHYILQFNGEKEIIKTGSMIKSK